MIVFFFGGQVLVNIIIDRRWPDVRDPRQGAWLQTKLDHLRLCQGRHPERPLVMMFGSSMTSNAFRAEELGEITLKTSMPVTAFNFGVPGAGTIKQALFWKYLQKKHVRPDLLLLEITPRHLLEIGPLEGEFPSAYERLVDLPALKRYVRVPLYRLCLSWLKARSIPVYGFRSSLMGHLKREALTQGKDPTMRLVDDFGWLPLPGQHTAESRERYLGTFHERLLKGCPAFPRDYQISRGAQRAFSELLQNFQDQGIPVIIVRMPEESSFRQWSAPNTESKFRALLDGLRLSSAARYIDAHDWVPDDLFADHCHMLPGGATIFTRRLADELLPLAFPTGWKTLARR
jgi:hypothetical protein